MPGFLNRGERHSSTQKKEKEQNRGVKTIKALSRKGEPVFAPVKNHISLMTKEEDLAWGGSEERL